MPPISVLIKPASGNCNMRCGYCFYRDLMEKRRLSGRGIMLDETARMIVDRIFEVAEGQAEISFQGGEPTLAGLEFFRKFVSDVKSANVNHVKVHFSLQTNGTTIDEEWCAFFKENDFLVGVSLDGIKEIHDSMRSGGDYNRIVKNIRLLQRFGVEYSVLTVVTKYVAKHGEKVYRNLRNIGCRQLQFIPCLCDFSHPPSYALDSELYGEFLVRLYALWREDHNRGDGIRIRNIDNVLSVLSGRRPEMCAMQGHCAMQNVVEADGTVYPCDFYCSDDFEAGNLRDFGFRELFAEKIAQNFLLDAPQQNDGCRACRFFFLCRGGCKREYADGRNVFCSAYQKFFECFFR